MERFGVGPASIPDYLALVGDASDGFPGVPGWGEKASSLVLARYAHLEAIPEAAFNATVAEVTAAAPRLIDSLTTSAAPRNREEVARKARERTARRFGAAARSAREPDAAR